MTDLKDFLKLLAEGRLSGKAIELSELMENIMGEDDKTPVGKVSPELLKKYKRFLTEKDMFDDEIELFTKQANLEITRKLHEKYGEKLEEFKERKTELWDEISDVVGVSRDEELSINIKTGVVSGKQKKKDSRPNLSLVKADDSETPLN